MFQNERVQSYFNENPQFDRCIEIGIHLSRVQCTPCIYNKYIAFQFHVFPLSFELRTKMDEIVVYYVFLFFHICSCICINRCVVIVWFRRWHKTKQREPSTSMWVSRIRGRIMFRISLRAEARKWRTIHIDIICIFVHCSS